MIVRHLQFLVRKRAYKATIADPLLATPLHVNSGWSHMQTLFETDFIRRLQETFSLVAMKRLGIICRRSLYVWSQGLTTT